MEPSTKLASVDLRPMRDPGSTRRERSRRALTPWLAAGIGAVLLASASILAAAPRQLVVVLDGLRPDYVRPDLMPHLTALARKGIEFRRHHAVYPTVTRVNAASISTGSPPFGHGLMGNSMYEAAVDAEREFTTSDRTRLLELERSAGGRLLTATTLGEALARAGKKLVVASSGSSGSSYLLHPRVPSGAIFHHQYVLPTELEATVRRELGPAPAEASPNRARHRWVIDALLRIGFDQLDADAAIVWLSDPDSAAHDHGIGSAEAAAALGAVDDELNRLLGELTRRGLDFDVFVTSDHGFSTHLGGFELDRAVTETWSSSPGPPPVAAGGAIYLRDARRDLLATLVEKLQASAWAGAVFSPARKPGDPVGELPGTLSFDLIGWQHERSADLLVSPNWSPAENQAGWAGATTAAGVAGHGSTSPWDIHNTLIAAGPRSSVGGDPRPADVEHRPGAHALPAAGRRGAGVDGRESARRGATRGPRSCGATCGRVHRRDRGRRVSAPRSVLAARRAPLPRRHRGRPRFALRLVTARRAGGRRGLREQVTATPGKQRGEATAPRSGLGWCEPAPSRVSRRAARSHGGERNDHAEVSALSKPSSKIGGSSSMSNSTGNCGWTVLSPVQLEPDLIAACNSETVPLSGPE